MVPVLQPTFPPSTCCFSSERLMLGQLRHAAHSVFPRSGPVFTRPHALQSLRADGESRACHLSSYFSPKISYDDSQSQLQPLEWECLRHFPAQDLVGKVVLVRCDLSVSLVEGNIIDAESIVASLPTIMYLRDFGARVVLASHWHPFQCSNGTTESQLIADCLSRHLNQKIFVIGAVIGDGVAKEIRDLRNGAVLLLGNLHVHKEEAANDKQFSRKFAENVDILVNDAFSVSHRVLASTVGAACFTSSRLAGLQLERELAFLTVAMNTPKLPFVAIVGGSKVSQVIDVLYNLLSKCSSIIVTGSMVYTFFTALGGRCPSDFIEKTAVSDALSFLRNAATKGVHVLLPEDLLCVREGHVNASFRVDTVPEGWLPICFGQNSWRNIKSTLQASKMALWIGPVSPSNSVQALQASKLLARIFGEISVGGCITIVGGKEAATSVTKEGVSDSISHISRGGAAFLEILRGVNLPGVSALDFACPRAPVWEKIYRNPCLPLFVDIGSGNGIFDIQMAKRFEKSLNFLGFEIRKKLVDRCLNAAVMENLCNLHFIKADATTAFERVVSTYPGQVTIVAIQCPDPDFLNPDSRRRMVQTLLVKGVIDILPKNGKVFLQSDVKAVAKRLRQDFLELGESYITLSIEHLDKLRCDSEGWLLDNPYGVLTDWESHVLQRGDRMYRVLLTRL